MQLIANGLTTVPTHELLNFIGEYIAKEPVERIIIGLPKQMNNEVSENMKNIEPFVRSLKKRYPDLPVEYVDERLLSKYVCKIIVALISSTNALFCRSFFFKPASSIVRCARTEVKRGDKIRVKYMDENFVEYEEEVEGYLARVMQHEFDHLDGKMFIDHISPLRKQMIKGKLNTMLKGKARSSYKMKQVK